MARKGVLALMAMALVPTVMSREGLHLGSYGLLQIHPSFVGDSIALYPAHHPSHDAGDLSVLTPAMSNVLYYAQEGHRPAVHGAKHASLSAEFNKPTVVLDQTSEVHSIDCDGKGNIKVCFSIMAFSHVAMKWNLPDLYLATYHVGCGSQHGGVRTYFSATDIKPDPDTACISMKAKPVKQTEAITSGEIEWGTYEDPKQRKRVPVKGHVRMSEAEDPFLVKRDESFYRPPGAAKEDNTTISPRDVHGEDDDGAGPPLKPQRVRAFTPVDLTRNVSAFAGYFNLQNVNPKLMKMDMPPGEVSDYLGLATADGVEIYRNENGDEIDKRRIGTRRLSRHDLEERGIVDFFKDLWKEIKGFFEKLINWFRKVFRRIKRMFKILLEVCIITGKLVMVPFGVPFDHSLEHDIKFSKTIKARIGNEPLKIFNYTKGLNLAVKHGSYSIQCVKCGIHGHFTVNGRLKFDIVHGIREGWVVLTNNEPLRLDAIFGIKLGVDKSFEKSVEIKKLKRKIIGWAFTPLQIPGVLMLGPEINLKTALALNLGGKADMVAGGTVSMAPGVARLSLVNKTENKLEGFKVKFTPVAQFEGSIKATIEWSLPVSFEVGLKVLDMDKLSLTVELVNSPSVYVSAEVAINKPDTPCNHGLELRVGVKNSITIQLFGAWSENIRDDVLFEKGIACVTKDGFDTKAVQPIKSVFLPVTEKLNVDFNKELDPVPGKKPPPDHALDPRPKEGAIFIMDEDKTCILVSGADGHLYLVAAKSKYDMSAPWTKAGNITINAVNMDVKGRMISFTGDAYGGRTAEIRVYEPKKVSEDSRIAALANLETEENNYQTYGIVLARKKKFRLWYTTFCQTSEGLRLIATRKEIDKEGNIIGSKSSQEKIKNGLAQFGRTGKCRSIRLTSMLKNK